SGSTASGTVDALSLSVAPRRVESIGIVDPGPWRCLLPQHAGIGGGTGGGQPMAGLVSVVDLPRDDRRRIIGGAGKGRRRFDCEPLPVHRRAELLPAAAVG